jgi:hypothetical protein
MRGIRDVLMIQRASMVGTDLACVVLCVDKQKGRRGKKKAKTEPVFGEIVVEEFTYDPNDFTIQNQ